MADANFYKVSFIANILDHALRDNTVMAGMGAGIILTGIGNAINIRVVRLMEERIRAIARVKSIPYDDAFDLSKGWTRASDFIARYFDNDPGDPSYYHAWSIQAMSRWKKPSEYWRHTRAGISPPPQRESRSGPRDRL
jgi:hypothetical protein